MDGLFVDQKWVDIGSVLFHATAFRHYGYNVGIGNLHERVIESDADGPYVAKNGDRLRLFHFHAFDPQKPDELSAKFVDRSHGDVKLETETVKELCRSLRGCRCWRTRSSSAGAGQPALRLQRRPS